MGAHNALRCAAFLTLFVLGRYGPTLLTVAVAVAVVATIPIYVVRSRATPAALRRLDGQLARWRRNHGAMLRHFRQDVENRTPPPWGRPRLWSWEWTCDRIQDLAGAVGVGFVVFVIVAPDTNQPTALPVVAGVAAAAVYVALVSRLARARDSAYTRYRQTLLEYLEWQACRFDAVLKPDPGIDPGGKA